VHIEYSHKQKISRPTCLLPLFAHIRKSAITTLLFTVMSSQFGTVDSYELSEIHNKNATVQCYIGLANVFWAHNIINTVPSPALQAFDKIWQYIFLHIAYFLIEKNIFKDINFFLN
jgi:hypothetical protein